LTASLLLDTHIVIWLRTAPRRLTSREMRALDAARLRHVSAVTLWEIAVLMGLGRIGSDERVLEAPDGFELLPVRPEHCKALLALPQRHRDPFDRMLIAQARVENLMLLTRDRAIIDYGEEGASILPVGD
jgi:PIN domain nuclease of toxin-antitoxin system